MGHYSGGGGDFGWDGIAILVIGHGGVWSCVVFCFGSMKFGSLGVNTQVRDLN